jgi:hypothetical protein
MGGDLKGIYATVSTAPPFDGCRLPAGQKDMDQGGAAKLIFDLFGSFPDAEAMKK